MPPEMDSQFQIYDCGEGQVCGRITWLEQPNDENGVPNVDVNNIDESLRGRPLLGMEFLIGFIVDERKHDKWKNGRIYSPRNGKTYKSIMQLDGEDTLKVRGYVGVPVLGKTEIWTRAEPKS
ncbi:MAG TPA: DUF2147 domain-containing protein [Alphaproteobacteria bacterium]|nr:DUF2147 domain-containing protein [Alphaproteobacteria bacterium]